MAKHFVQNIHEDSQGNFIRMWEDTTHKDAGKCHREGCDNKATDGSHVFIKNSDSKKWYIVPLCHRCNCQFGQSFYVEGPLVGYTDKEIIQ